MFALLTTKMGRIVVPMYHKNEEELNRKYEGQLEAVYERWTAAQKDKERLDRLDEDDS